MLDKILKGIIALMLIFGLVILILGLGSGKHEDITEIEINAPTDIVFNYITDDNNMAAWLKGFVSIKIIGGEKGQPGSKYELIFEKAGKVILMTETITEIIPNKQFSFDMDSKTSASHIDILLEPSGSGTNVKEVHKFTVEGFVAKAFMNLFSGLMKKEKLQMYQELKKNIEAKQ